MAGAGDTTGMDGTGRARAGTWLAFFVTGAVAASWAARVPAVQERLDLSPGELAVVVLGIEGGALLGLPLGGALVARWGNRRSLRAGFAVYAPGLLAAALAPTLTWLVAGLAVWAAANSVLDVALNAQGVALNRAYGRPVLSGLHAAQGAGLLAGALAATAAAASGVGLLAHHLAVAVLAAAVGLAATGPLGRERDARPGPRGLVLRPGRPLVAAGLIAFCAFAVDGAATSWIAVHLGARHGAGHGLAAAGYLLFTAAVVLGRLGGDRLTARLRRGAVVRGCGLLVAAGAAVTVFAPNLPVALAGWLVVGLGVAPLAPAVLGAAPGLGDVPAPAAIATVTAIGYLGSFSGPPLIGVLAGPLGLWVAPALVGAAGVTAALLAPRRR